MRSTHQCLGAPERSKKSGSDLNPTQNSRRLCISLMTLLKATSACLKLESNKICILRIMERELMCNSGSRRVKYSGFGKRVQGDQQRLDVRSLPRDSFSGMKEPSPSQASSGDFERAQCDSGDFLVTTDVLYQPCVSAQCSRSGACLSILT